ncbi:tbc domain protein [Diplocarpon rosae]|nr:tbc domain protein [Diplocarpon rosae]
MTFSPAGTPGSPPDLSGSKSSKSSSFHSSYQSDHSILSDVDNFEDIGLDDEARSETEMGPFDPRTKTTNKFYEAAAVTARPRPPMAGTSGNRAQRDLTAGIPKSQGPGRRGQVRGAADARAAGLPTPHRRGLASASAGPLPGLPGLMRRNRSISPGLMRHPSANLSVTALPARRRSWQANRERKTAAQLERECDEDDGDDVPDEVLLENVPITPRLRPERTRTPASAATSPERPPRSPPGRVRSLGNGTSPRPAEQGEFAPPTLRSAAAARASATSGTAARAELPPLRRTDLMIDPLPISREKEAVLSRTRPSWLPPKDPAEEKRHLKEYQAMMASAQKAARQRAAHAQARTTGRDATATSLRRIWEEHVWPNWDEVTRQKRTRELWWRGIAPRSRGIVWQRAIGNQLDLSDASYTAARRRAQALEQTIQRGAPLSPAAEKTRLWLHRIEHDVATTYPELRIFQPGGPLHGPLLDVLKAYAMYRSDVGHVPGTSTIAALLLLNLPSPAASFFAPARAAPLRAVGGPIRAGPAPRPPPLDLSYLHPLITSLFTSTLSLDHATRLWDVMVFEGDSTLVRSAVALLLHGEARLFGVHTRAEVARVLEGGLSPGTGEEEWMTWKKEKKKKKKKKRKKKKSSIFSVPDPV